MSDTKNQGERLDPHRCASLCWSLTKSRVREKHVVEGVIIRRRLCNDCEDPRDFFTEEKMVESDSKTMKKVMKKKVLRSRDEDISFVESRMNNISHKLTGALRDSKGRYSDSGLDAFRNDIFGVLDTISEFQMQFAFLKEKSRKTT